MKKEVKPSPLTVIILGVAMCICVVFTVAGFFTENSLIFPELLMDLVVACGFVWLLLKYLSQKSISYDEKCFIVDGKTYYYTDITNVTVEAEQFIRNVSTLRIKVYIDKEEICSFTKDDKGGKDFIAVLKNNDVAVNIEV